MNLDEVIKEIQALKKKANKTPKTERERIDLLRAQGYNKALKDIVKICGLHNVSGCNIGFDCKRYANRSHVECNGCSWYQPRDDNH